MSAHPFDNGFRITPEHKMQFQRDGFVKLEGFLNGAVVDMLLDRTEREMQGNTRNTTTEPVSKVGRLGNGNGIGVPLM